VKALAAAVFVGGPNNVDPGGSVTATVHLEPGEVNVVQTAASVEDPPLVDAGTISLRYGRESTCCCGFFPDPTKGNLPHVLEGMIKEITIS
jgi:hypothetical protein